MDDIPHILVENSCPKSIWDLLRFVVMHDNPHSVFLPTEAENDVTFVQVDIEATAAREHQTS